MVDFATRRRRQSSTNGVR